MVSRRDAIRLALGTTAGMAIVSTSSYGVSKSKHKTLQTRFSRHFKLKHPFVCAGMAIVCDTSPLAIAVSRAGGVGCLAGTLLSPSTLEQRIDEIRNATDGIFHVNLLTPFPHEQQIDVCLAKKVPIVSFHWGVPNASTVKRLQSTGTSVWIQVGPLDAAIQARDIGADCIVVQGSEAGGHNYGTLPLTNAIASIRQALGDEVLLLGAGGVSDGHTAAAALVAGADGIWVGTRMVATVEANAHDEYKRRLVEASGEATVLTSVYGPEMPAFNPIRVIENAVTREWENKAAQLPIERSDMASIGKTVFAEQEREVKPFDSISPVPETSGDFDQMPMMSGQGVGLVNEIAPAGEVLEKLMNDAALAILLQT